MTTAIMGACEKAVHVVKADGGTLKAGRAVLFILEELRWGWFAKLMTLPPFIWFIELGYKVFSKNRNFFAKFMFKRENVD